MVTNKEKHGTRRFTLEGVERQFREQGVQLVMEARSDVEEWAHPSYLEVMGEVRASGDESNAERLTYSERTEISRHADALQDGDAALARIGTGSFGACLDGSDEIDINRLRAYPTALRCIG